MNDSPKTPILKSNSNKISTPSNTSGHFTPCRQMGLSRKRNSSVSVASPLYVTNKSNTESSNESPKNEIVKRSRISYPIDNETPKSEIQRTRISYPIDNAKKRNLSVLLSNEEHTDEEVVKSEINACKARIEEKRKILNELQKSVKNTDNDLEDLIVKWRTGCQNALTMLLDEAKENRPIDMNTLLNDLNIPASLVHYDTENEAFL